MELSLELLRDQAQIHVVDLLFNRSHAFREQILEDFQTLMELTLGKILSKISW